MSLVAAGLWGVGTILGHARDAVLQADRPTWLDLTLGDAIAAVSVVASLLLFAYTRTPNREPAAHPGSRPGLHGPDRAWRWG